MQIPAHLIFGPAAALAGAATIILWRIQETRRRVTRASVVLPPIGMSTGLLMFALPAVRIPWGWALCGLLLGALLSVPLARTSRLERVGDIVMMRRSRAFLSILLVLAAVRLALHEWIGAHISPLQTGGLFFVIAFGMIVVWRARMLREYLRLQN